MVAPTRAPEARGAKCELCKKILAQATWLDQTKLAKKAEEAQAVLDLINKHDASDCPCIPRNIQTLLVGSTHFEIHRLVARSLDLYVYRLQEKHFTENKSQKQTSQTINDCNEIGDTSRFKSPPGLNDPKSHEKISLSLKHLNLSIDFWRLAMDDQVNLFNSKLALRLGLTHHVIYACYLYKYYKILDYQLISANLLLNLFRSIEGVTLNAIIHASYLLVRSLMDCKQFSLARSHFKEATKLTNFSDKSYYESILLTCAACELSLLDNEDSFNALDELAKLSIIQPDDKLQHYYARALAIGTVIKYIHLYPGRSDNCYEFYHTFRYTCAIMRRCYETSFELVLGDKDSRGQSKSSSSHGQILDHNWIRFAVCDFVYSAFDMISQFYFRAGKPENLEIIYNALSLISLRSGSYYWQARILTIGANLDILCDKIVHAEAKLHTMSRIIGHSDNVNLMNLLRLDLEVNSLLLHHAKNTVIQRETVMDLLQRLKDCYLSLSSRIAQIELYDCKYITHSKLASDTSINHSLVVLGHILGRLGLEAIKILVKSLIRSGDVCGVQAAINDLGFQLANSENLILDYNENHSLLEILIYSIDIEKTDQVLLDAIYSSNTFLNSAEGLSIINFHLSNLTLSSESITTISTVTSNEEKKASIKRKPKSTRVSSLNRRSRRKGTYDVASREANLPEHPNIRYFDTIEAIKNVSFLTHEEIVACYLRNSEPNPDYLLYRCAHERMFSYRLKEGSHNSIQLLYHFCESATSNTMRYRWMMFDEQQIGLARHQNGSKHLGFSGILVNHEKTLKSFARHIPDDTSLLHLKFILDQRGKTEHLLIACFDADLDPVFVHVGKPISSDDFFKDTGESHYEANTLPNQFVSKIEEAKKTLFINNHRARIEARQKIERDLDLILYNIEKEWFGIFKFVLCGKILDIRYRKFVQDLADGINSMMNAYTCKSTRALGMMLENAPLLSREEFCQAISSIFGCPASCDDARKCFDKWLESIEYLTKGTLGPESINKTTYLQGLHRGQLGLIMDRNVELLPLESLRVVRIAKPGVFRVPSLRLFSVIAARHCQPIRLDKNKTFYLLDPAGNLSKTRERFENKLRSQKTWVGTIGQPPKEDQLEQWFSSKEIYLFIGHGAGTTYYNKLCKGRGLSAMERVRCASLLMGCSSARASAEGPRLESFGICWVFIFRGSPSFAGLLWDVTDTDIDRFLSCLLARWTNLESFNNSSKDLDNAKPSTNIDRGLDNISRSIALTDAVAQARSVCKNKFLVGAAPVVYGLPVWCQSTDLLTD